MSIDRRRLLMAAGLAGLAGRRGFAEVAAQPYRVAERGAILAAARALIAEDTVATLITVDGDGVPRSRSMRVGRPDEDLTLWMGTRAGSRKLEQLAAHPAATLHFAVDGQAAYASLMGRARVSRDAGLIAAKNPFTGAALKEYFPRFPEDFVLIGLKPAWLEVVVDALPTTPGTWQPQGVVL